MVGYIYLNTDLKTGKQYTGQHHYDKEGELDPNYHGSGVLWTKVLKKRPKELIKEEYIKTCYSEEEMNSDEQYYIKLFKTLYPNGYNLTEGGEGCVASEESRKKMSLAQKGKHISEEQKKKLSIALKGRIMSDEHKKKIGEASKGRHHSEESKKKMSLSKKGKPSGMLGKKHSEESKKKMSQNHYDCSGEKNPLFGKHLSEETKKKMSLSKKGKPNLKLSKKVLQFTLDGEFVKEWPSAAECGRNGFDRNVIRLCCQGKYKQAYGFKWMYADDYIE